MTPTEPPSEDYPVLTKCWVCDKPLGYETRYPRPLCEGCNSGELDEVDEDTARIAVALADRKERT